MGIVDKITGLFGSDSNSEIFSNAELVEAGVCPNCWGKQSYDDKFLEIHPDSTKANINNDKTAKKAFIQQFVETNVTGIKLKSEGENNACPACKSKF